MPTIDCPNWESDAEVKAELLGEAPHSALTCGQCVCWNGRSHVTQDGNTVHSARIGSCTPVGERYADARACHRFYSTKELNAPLYGAKR